MDKNKVLTNGICSSPATDYVFLQDLGDVVSVYLKDVETHAVRSALLPSPSKEDVLDYIPYGYRVEFH